MVRRTVQLLLLALFVLLLLRTSWSLPELLPVDLFLRMDPLVSSQAVLAGRVWVAAAWIGLAVLVLSGVLGRFFCGWVCPMGAVLELGDAAMYRKRARRHRRWGNEGRRLRGVKYAVLITVLLAAVFGVGLAYLVDPIVWTTRLFTYAIWPLCLVVTDLALDLLRPIFEALGWMNLARAETSDPLFGVHGLLALGFFATLLWLGRWQERLWCRSLCPAGALMAIPARLALFRRKVVDEQCNDCGKCVKVCSAGAIREGRVSDPGECVRCGRCVQECPTDAVDFRPGWQSDWSEPSFDLGRRQTVTAVATGTLGAAWLLHDPARAVTPEDALRPPGALPEEEFLATCVRCGQCVKACPTACLGPSWLETGAVGLMTPLAVMRRGACDPNCLACGNVCPTGAIRRLDAQEKPWAKIGNAVLIPETCVAWEQDRACLVCDEHCPFGAIEWIDEGAERRPVVNENRCNGCGQCEEACPVEGTSAIRVFVAGQIRLSDGSYRQTAREAGLMLEDREEDEAGAYPWEQGGGDGGGGEFSYP